MNNMPERPTDKAIRLFKKGQIKEALQIAQNFKIGLTREDRAELQRGYEAHVRPEFYAQLGKCPQQMISIAIKTFSSRFFK